MTYQQDVAESNHDTSGMVQACLLGLLVAIAYFVVSRSNGFIYDDYNMVVNKPPLNSLSGLWSLFTQRPTLSEPYYRAVTSVTLQGQKALHGDDPRFFHLVNAVLAGMVLVATYLLLRRPRFQISRLPALFAALLFVVHPAASECVYPAASGRETMFPLLLILLSLTCYMRSGWTWYSASLLLFMVSILSKELAVILPVVFFVVDALGLTDDSRAWPARTARYVPICVILAGYALLRMVLFADLQMELAILRYPSLPMLSYLYAIQSIILPQVQLVYEPPAHVWWSWPRVAIGLCIMMMLLVVGFVNLDRRVMCFWSIWFMLVQLPTANIFRQWPFFSDRWVFPAAIAVFAILAGVMTKRRLSTNWPSVSMMFLLLILLWGISLNRSQYFLDQPTFLHQWIRTNPQTPIGHFTLALWYQEQGEVPLAIEHYEQALFHFESHPREYLNLTSAYNNLGCMLAMAGRMSDAAQAFERGILADPHDVFLRFNYGLTLEAMGLTDRAMEQYVHALRNDPQHERSRERLMILQYRR